MVENQNTDFKPTLDVAKMAAEVPALVRRGPSTVSGEVMAEVISSLRRLEDNWQEQVRVLKSVIAYFGLDEDMRE